MSPSLFIHFIFFWENVEKAWVSWGFTPCSEFLLATGRMSIGKVTLISTGDLFIRREKMTQIINSSMCCRLRCGTLRASVREIDISLSPSTIDSILSLSWDETDVGKQLVRCRYEFQTDRFHFWPVVSNYSTVLPQDLYANRNDLSTTSVFLLSFPHQYVR